MHIFHAKFRLFFCRDNSSFVHYVPCMDIAYHPPMPSTYYQHVARTAFCNGTVTEPHIKQFKSNPLQ